MNAFETVKYIDKLEERKYNFDVALTNKKVAAANPKQQPQQHEHKY